MATHRPSKLIYTPMPDGSVFIEPVEMRCDFCLSDEPTWAYPATSFDITPCLPVGATEFAKQMSHEAWTACDECSAMIESRRYAELTDRAFAVMSAMVVPGRAVEVRESLRRLHRAFSDHRHGDRVPLDEWMQGLRRKEH